MKRRRLIQIVSGALVVWSLASLVQGGHPVEQYGAGTICDKCDDWCYTTTKSWTECYYESPGDNCLTNKCIINSMFGATCDPDDNAPPGQCPIRADFGAVYMYQIARKNTTCDSDDWSTGRKPVVDWGRCEYCSNLGSGRCLSTTGCTGDLDWERSRTGNYVCDN